jgi:Arc/MetJ-type ribon-helix-helix transcriptional regulator
MKHRVSISIGEETLLKVFEEIRNGRFRNRSHAVEYALQMVLRGEKE